MSEETHSAKDVEALGSEERKPALASEVINTFNQAQVLSNWGDRWLIELAEDAHGRAGVGERLCITIPGTGVQTIRRMAPKAEADAACHRSLWSSV